MVSGTVVFKGLLEDLDCFFSRCGGLRTYFQLFEARGQSWDIAHYFFPKLDPHEGPAVFEAQVTQREGACNSEAPSHQSRNVCLNGRKNWTAKAWPLNLQLHHYPNAAKRESQFLLEDDGLEAQ